MFPTASGFSFNSFDSAKEKLLAWAAAINSAGSEREWFLRGTPNENLACFNILLSVVTARVPPLRPPFQTTDAFRIIRLIAELYAAKVVRTNTLFLGFRCLSAMGHGLVFVSER
jgi:hypothetical protein